MNSIENNIVRLGELNLISGGFKDGYADKSIYPQSMPDIVEVVRSLHTNYITLVDTFHWDTVYAPEQLRELFGFQYAYCINLNDDRLRRLGHNNGITILSNFDNPKFQTVSLGTRDAVKASLHISGKPVDIFSVYLDDVAEKRRMQQVEALIKYVEPNKRTIIMGDFNSIADRDVASVQKTFQRIYRYLPRRLKHRFYSVESKIAHRGTIQLLESHGFVDAAATNPESTVPTKKFYPLISPFLRLDYAFCTKDISIASTQVLRGKQFDQISDHYPFVLEINGD